MLVTIINPNIVAQKGDFFGTGIPYMPIIPAYLTSYLLNKKHKVEVIDSFGEDPSKKRTEDDLIIYGLSIGEIIEKVNEKTDIICIYAGHAIEHSIIINILNAIKKKFKRKKVLIFENSQAVTAYSLRVSYKEFFKKNCDFIVYGDPEETVHNLLSNKSLKNIDGLIYKEKNKIVVNKPYSQKQKLDNLPFPAWGLFPLKNYWKLKYAHAPYKNKYIPLLTSRGCPFQCEFCIIPFTNRRIWRARSPENLISEIKEYKKKYKVKEFHIEDLNPTLDKKRIKKLCNLIINLKLNIVFKFASGVKIESIDEETLKLLHKAGCRYISFSPESGSKKVLKLMKKPFDYEHGIKIAKLMSKLKIISQACFVLGFPGETKKDLKLTKEYSLKLIRNGVDELAFFIMTPVPGSKPYEYSQFKCKELSKLTFSPKWRKEYKNLHKFRTKVYIYMAINKLIYHPLKTLKQPLNFLTKNFETKMEMTLYRIIKSRV